MKVDAPSRLRRWPLVLLLAAGSYLVGPDTRTRGASPVAADPASATDNKKDNDKDQAKTLAGRGGRVAWTTSKLKGAPDPPPPYRVEPAFPQLKFDSPVVVGAARGIDRLFVAELGGKILSFPNRPDADRAEVALDLKRAKPGVSSLFGMAFPPNFERTKRVFLCYTLQGGGPEGTHVSSFSVVGTDPPRIAPESEKLLLTWQAGGHNAGCLAFDPAGMLYIGAGDTADPTPPDPLRTGQMISDIPASILRIDVDHADPGKNYQIPADNPFVSTPGARPEVWAFGLRNPWRFSVDRQTGDVWAGDVGWELWELIHLVRSGGNYGWSIMEGPQPVYPDGKRGPGPIIPPVVAHPHSEAGSITGGYVYRGQKQPGLVGVYIYGDFQSGKVWGIRHDGQKLTWKGELADTPLQLVSFGEDNEGEVYAVDFQRTHQIYQFVPDTAADTAAAFPKTLGQTGLFADVQTMTPAPGVYPYAINAALWADHAEAERWLAIPGSGQVVADATKPWQAPDGTVLARTITLEMERGNSKTRRRLETQILHQEAGTWRPYAYVWNEAQTDATLADAQGMSRVLQVKDAHAPGGASLQTYRTFARSECVVCHNPWVERQTTIFGRQTASPLAFHTAQLNRPMGSGTGASAKNQLQALRDLNLIDGPSPHGSEPLPRLADPYDRKADVNARARSYLGVNCAHCHIFGAGGSANIFLSASFPIEKTKTLNATPMQGTFGIADAKIITPGDPASSILYYRMAKLGGGRMPRSGSHMVDEAAVKLIHDWIKGMPGASGSTGSPELKDARAALAHLEAGPRSAPQSRVDAVHRLLASPPPGALADAGD